jgi:hypothetical protein
MFDVPTEEYFLIDSQGVEVYRGANPIVAAHEQMLASAQ